MKTATVKNISGLFFFLFNTITSQLQNFGHHMKKIVLFVPFLLAIYILPAQTNLPVDRTTGHPYQVTRTEEIQGSEFLYANWAPAEVTFIDGQTIPNIPVKFDVYKNSFYYKNNDTVFEFSRPIRQVILYPPGTDTLSKFVIQRDLSRMKWKGAGKYIQVLCTGTNSLVKYYYKSVGESFEYGNGRPSQVFKDENELYMITAEGPVRIKSIKKDAKAAFGDKWKTVEAFLKTNHLSLKSLNDLVQAVQYLNKL